MEYTQELRKQLLFQTQQEYESLTPEEREVAERLRRQLLEAFCYGPSYPYISPPPKK